MKKIYVVTASLEDDIPEFFFEDDLKGIINSFNKKTKIANEVCGGGWLFVEEFLPNPSLTDLVENTEMVYVQPFEEKIFNSAIFDTYDHNFNALCSAFKEWAEKIDKKKNMN